MSMRFGAGLGIGIGVPSSPAIPFEERVSKLKTIPMSTTVSNNTWHYMASEKCTPGKIWEVTRIAVQQSNDPSAAPAGTMYAAIGVQVPQSGATPAPLPDSIAVAGSIPNTTYPVKGSVYLQEGERVIIGLKGVPNATELSGVVAVIEHDRQALLRSLVPQPPPPTASGNAADNR